MKEALKGMKEQAARLAVEAQQAAASAASDREEADTNLANVNSELEAERKRISSLQVWVAKYFIHAIVHRQWYISQTAGDTVTSPGWINIKAYGVLLSKRCLVAEENVISNKHDCSFGTATTHSRRSSGSIHVVDVPPAIGNEIFACVK